MLQVLHFLLIFPLFRCSEGTTENDSDQSEKDNVVITDPSSFLPTLVFPMDEPNKTKKIKNKFEKMLTSFQEQLSEPKFSNDFDDTFKTQMFDSKEKEKEKQSEAPNSTMLSLIDFLKDNEEVKSMATNLIKSALPNIVDSFNIMKKTNITNYNPIRELEKVTFDKKRNANITEPQLINEDQTEFNSNVSEKQESSSESSALVTTTEMKITNTAIPNSTTQNTPVTSTEILTTAKTIKTLSNNQTISGSQPNLTITSVNPIKTTQVPTINISSQTPLVFSTQITPSNTPIATSQTSVTPKAVTISKTAFIPGAELLPLQNGTLRSNMTNIQLSPKFRSPTPILNSSVTTISTVISENELKLEENRNIKVSRDDPVQDLLDVSKLLSLNENIKSNVTDLKLPPKSEILTPITIETTISPLKQTINFEGGEKRNIEVSKPDSDPIQDLEMSKFNLSELYIDKNKSVNISKPQILPKQQIPILTTQVTTISTFKQVPTLTLALQKSVLTTTRVTTISPVKPVSGLAGRKKRNIEFIQHNDDPIRDLEMTKFNLKKFIFDENKNDINLLHDLEEKIKTGKNEKPDISLLKVKLFKVVQLLLIDAHKAGIKSPEGIFIKAMKTAEIGTSHARRRRSINEDGDINKVNYSSDDGNIKTSKLELEQNVLAQIFRELDDLEVFSSANKDSLKRRTKGEQSTSAHGKTEVEKTIPLATTIKDILLDDVTTLLAKAAAKKLMDDQKEENKYNELKRAIEVSLVDKIATFLSKTAVEKYFEDNHNKESNANQKVLDDYILLADSVKQDMFRESSDEIYFLEEFPENGDDQNLVDSEEQLMDRKSPILYNIGSMDLQSDRVQERKILSSVKEKSPDGEGKASFTIQKGKDPTEWEIVSSSFGVAEKAIKNQETKIDPSMEFLEKAIDIVALIESKP